MIWNNRKSLIGSILPNERTENTNEIIWYLAQYGQFKLCKKCNNWYELNYSNGGYIRKYTGCLGTTVEDYYQNNDKDNSDLSKL